MTSALDYLGHGSSFSMPGATKWRRLRASRKPDPYNPAQTTSTAVLTVTDPNADIRLGDRIRPEPADGRMWEVSGFPNRDVNAFTGWQPTLEVQLTEWKG